jgi:hypothetical protein
MSKKPFFPFILICAFSLNTSIQATGSIDNIPNPSIKKIYEFYAGLSVWECDIGEHMPVLKQLAMECPSVCEIGLASVISTWAILQGLSENPAPFRSYVGLDIAMPPADNLQLAKEEAEKQGIAFLFRHGNDLYLDIEPVDLLFIDSMHTYCHLTYELEKFSPKVKKYIAMHDTSAPWGNRDDAEYVGNYSEYPRNYNRKKRGLWPAVVDFLARHPEWSLQERRLNCHGFTILKRRE